MSDIRYKWNDGLNSVQISSDVSLPQFKVLGHRQKTIEASLSTGDNQENLIIIITLTFSGPVSSKSPCSVSGKVVRLFPMTDTLNIVRGHHRKHSHNLSKVAEVFYNVKNGSSFISQKVTQRISVMKTNTGVFVVLETNHELKCQFSGNIKCVCFYY